MRPDPPADERASRVYEESYDSLNSNATIAAIAFEIRAAEAIARAEGRREGLEAAAKVADERAADAKASAACPVCGADTPHPHDAHDIGLWLTAMVSRWGYVARVVPVSALSLTSTSAYLHSLERAVSRPVLDRDDYDCLAIELRTLLADAGAAIASEIRAAEAIARAEGAEAMRESIINACGGPLEPYITRGAIRALAKETP